MLTKYYIEISGVRHEVPSHCIKNWDEVQCVYKRADFSGVTRSFTSQFEFVNEIYSLLMALYLDQGVNAQATLILMTITNSWEWEERFSAPIDFSSITWDDYVIKVNCLDDSLGAIIKSKKGVTYELEIGEEISCGTPVDLRRIPMTESVTFGLMGESKDDSAEMEVTPYKSECKNVNADMSDAILTSFGYFMPAYTINDEIYINNVIEFQDQDDSENPYIIKAKEDVSLTIKAGMRIEPTEDDKCQYCRLVKKDESGMYSQVMNLAMDNHPDKEFKGHVYDIPSYIPDKSQVLFVWETWTYWEYDTSIRQWVDTKLGWDEFQLQTATIDLKKGEELAITGGSTYRNGNTRRDPMRILSQKIEFSWTAKGETVRVNSIQPEELCDRIFDKMTEGKITAYSSFSDHDERLTDTVLLAAESIRGIEGAKIYSSFNDFVEWMEVVFGYTYYLEPKQEIKYVGTAPFAYTETCKREDIIFAYCGDSERGDIVFLNQWGVFAVRNRKDGKFYTKWIAMDAARPWTEYNASHDRARRDMIFTCDDTRYRVNHKFQLEACTGEISHEQKVRFVHRSELYKADSPRRIEDVVDVTYSVDNSRIYSSIEIGYKEQTYDNINGRYEFNFNNTYSTGCTAFDKKLSLISKYRADSYGIEFTCQKRGSDSTDSASDKDIFFVYTQTVQEEDNQPTLVIPVVEDVKGVPSALVYNTQFTPVDCLLVNKDYICMQSKDLNLTFASSTGNSEVEIGGESMKRNFELHGSLFTCGVLQFTCCDVDSDLDENQLIKVESHGMIYTGFIQEAAFHYATEEAVKYKLLVKDIELC